MRLTLHPRTRRSTAGPADVAAALACPFNAAAPLTSFGAFGHLVSALLFIAIGLFGATQAFPVFLHATRARLWPTTPGVVTSSHLVETRGRNPKTHVEVLALEYRFDVDGRPFEGSRWCFGVGAGPSARQNARAAALRYPAGAPVEVRFNPADPSDCTLETSVAGSSWAFVMVATVSLTLGGLWFMEGCRLLRESRRRLRKSA
jgi:hypothetical protein